MAKFKTVSSHQKGKKGEDRAAVYLRLKGYRILERNYRVPQGEIDLVASKRGVLAFIEVKARKGTLQGTPLEAVSPHKVRRLSAAASIYLANHPSQGTDCRFDIITLGPEKNWFGFLKIRHFENAFTAEGFFTV